MSYKFIPGETYRMPTHFGPSTGPRRGPDGIKFACKDGSESTTYAVSFLSDKAQLENLIPEGFQIRGEPVVTVAFSQLRKLEWLAGRGYNVLGVTLPVTFTGKVDRAKGELLTVLWENLCDPIITGREELGFSKIYCELPEPVTYNGVTEGTASWLGFKFMDLKIQDLKSVPAAEFPKPVNNRSADGAWNGLLHYKYMPKSFVPGSADAAYTVLTPAEMPNRAVQEISKGTGQVKFHRARWEDMPTQYTIVNALADLEIKEWRGGTIMKTQGSKDLSDQRILQ